MMTTTMMRQAALSAACLVGGLGLLWWSRSRSESKSKKRIEYGTAGFRGDASTLDLVMERVGVVAALRASDCGKAIGIMITASHNPVKDNGCKIVDPSGEMLAAEWEGIAEEIVNSEKLNLDRSTALKKATIIIGRDTRPHSAKFVDCVKRGAQICEDLEVIDLGLVTTPQLHYCVAAHNTSSPTKLPLYGYTKHLTEAVESLLQTKSKKKLLIDCAGGVGAVAAKALAEELSDLIDFSVFNTPDSKNVILNEQCGAEYVHKSQQPPSNLPAHASSFFAACSLDGDADRVVFFHHSSTTFSVLDGDKIAYLFTHFLKKQIDALGLQQDLKVGVVQTAYANGAATAALKSLNIPIITTKTGVKHLHRAAQQHFDIGIYFEANGHGTVLFSSEFYRVVTAQISSVQRNRLLAFAQLANQSIGDALADALLVYCVLVLEDSSVPQWLAYYTNRPNLTSKVIIKDRSVLETNHDDSKLTRPLALQAAIDLHVSKLNDSARAFVRPSGTEDIVRVYTEATTLAQSAQLNLAISQSVFDLADGIGPRPA